MFRDVPECSGMFRDVPCSWFYRRPVLHYITSFCVVFRLSTLYFWLAEKTETKQVVNRMSKWVEGGGSWKGHESGQAVFIFRVPGSYKTQAKDNGKLSRLYLRYCISARNQKWSPHFARSCYPVLERSESRPLSKFIVLCFTLRTYILLLKICKSLFNRGSTALIPIASSQILHSYN